MNIVRHRKYTLAFDVWEPTSKQVDDQIDKVIKYAKEQLTHVGALHITLDSEERYNGNT